MRHSHPMVARFPEGVTLRPGVRYCVEHGAPAIIFAGERLHRLATRDPARLLPVLAQLHAGADVGALLALLPDPDGSRLLDTLDRHGLLRGAYANEHAGTALERQVHYLAAFVADPNRAQRALRDAGVCIVGCGGLGGAVLQHLLGAGVARFWLIDFDRVAPDNFNRQFLPQWSDIGRPKVGALADAIRRLAPAVTVNECHGRVHDAADLELLLDGARPDVVLCCADSPLGVVQSAVARHCLNAGTACTFGGVGVEFGVVGPLLHESARLQTYLARMAKLVGIADDERAPTPLASFGVTNTIVAALLARDVIEYLAGIRQPATLNQMLRFRFADLGAVADGPPC